MREISKNILTLYDQIQTQSNSRLKSWEHCYERFVQDRRTEDYEHLSLHLFAYLASWGMLRGSSFLLQRDYLFHEDVVKEILKSKYDCLVAISPEDIDNEKIELMLSLQQKIKEIYRRKLDNTNLSNKSVSDTLTTKILLGTLGCVPAYDRFLINGMKVEGISPRTIVNKQSIIELVYFYKKHSISLDKVFDNINQNRKVPYPPMKLLDMYFWKLGYDL